MKQTLFEETIDGMLINHVIRDSKYTMPSKHLHNEYEIYYLIQGERCYFIEDQSYIIKKGSLILINRNQIHKTSLVNEPYHNRIVIELNSDRLIPFFSLIDKSTFEQFFAQNYGVLSLNEYDQTYIEHLLFGIIEELRTKRTDYKLIVYMKLAELIIFVTRYNENLLPSVSCNLTQKQQTVHNVLNYITLNLSDIKSLEDLSKHIYINKYYLSRIFKEVTGFTVNEYINIQRIKKAKKLLSDNNYNIEEISRKLGYQNVNYFEKVFKKYTETTPLKYRKKISSIAHQLRDKRKE